VEQVAAVGEHPDHVAVAVVVEADGAARLLLLPPRRRRLPGLRVRHHGERLERGLVDAPLDVAGARRRASGGDGHGRARAEVDGERDAGDDKEDADGDAHAVAEPADAARPEDAARGAAAVVARRRVHRRCSWLARSSSLLPRPAATCRSINGVVNASELCVRPAAGQRGRTGLQLHGVLRDGEGGKKKRNHGVLSWSMALVSCFMRG
jgi:hypothetical protein